MHVNDFYIEPVTNVAHIFNNDQFKSDLESFISDSLDIELVEEFNFKSELFFKYCRDTAAAAKSSGIYNEAEYFDNLNKFKQSIGIEGYACKKSTRYLYDHFKLKPLNEFPYLFFNDSFLANHHIEMMDHLSRFENFILTNYVKPESREKILNGASRGINYIAGESYVAKHTDPIYGIRFICCLTPSSTVIDMFESIEKNPTQMFNSSDYMAGTVPLTHYKAIDVREFDVFLLHLNKVHSATVNSSTPFAFFHFTIQQDVGDFDDFINLF